MDGCGEKGKKLGVPRDERGSRSAVVSLVCGVRRWREVRESETGSDRFHVSNATYDSASLAALGTFQWIITVTTVLGLDLT